LGTIEGVPTNYQGKYVKQDYFKAFKYSKKACNDVVVERVFVGYL
jgi:hypothetical protein